MYVEMMLTCLIAHQCHCNAILLIQIIKRIVKVLLVAGINTYLDFVCDC